MSDLTVGQTVLGVIRVLEIYENFPCSPSRRMEWLCNSWRISYIVINPCLKNENVLIVSSGNGDMHIWVSPEHSFLISKKSSNQETIINPLTRVCSWVQFTRPWFWYLQIYLLLWSWIICSIQMFRSRWQRSWFVKDFFVNRVDILEYFVWWNLPNVGSPSRKILRSRLEASINIWIII